MKPPRAVTFDVGQVLAVFEPRLLAGKLEERGGSADPEAIERAMPDGWAAYGSALQAGLGAEAGWKAFIATILERAGARPSPDPALLAWLYADNVPRNLWRRPVAPMIALVRSLRRAGVPVAAVSNSEGGLLDLMRDLGCADDFVCIADSAKVGCDKPSPGIFRWAFERLGVSGEEVVHIGDSWAADVEGALGVGARAIWFPAADARQTDRARVWPARDADEVKAGLAAFGLPRHALDGSSLASIRLARLRPERRAFAGPGREVSRVSVVCSRLTRPPRPPRAPRPPTREEHDGRTVHRRAQ